MKILKNLFGSKTKEKAKYDGNTLAEMNGSPDMRLATAKEKEWDAPFYVEKKASKKEKKAAKKASEAIKAEAESVAPAQKSTSSASAKKTSKATTSAKKVDAQANVEPAKKADSTTKKGTADTKAAQTKKSSTPASKPAEAAAKSEEKKTASTKKQSAETTAKKTDSAKKQPAETTEKQASQSVKKSAATAKKSLESSAKKPSGEVKKSATATEVSSQSTDEITESKATRTGKFEIKKSKDGRFVFNLYASNNVIVATSQIYSSSTSAMNGIKSVVANAAIAQIEDQSLKKVTTVPFPKWEIYQDKGEQYRFRLCASNGSCVCHSQGYTSKANCKKGIESIIKFASDAEITKVYLEKKDK